VIGLGEYIISRNPKDILKILGLSSCVGLYIYCRKKKMLGMAHIVLPSSTIYKHERGFNPVKYADTAIEEMLKIFCCKGGCRHQENLEIRIYGGIDSGTGDFFRIGEKNREIVRNELIRRGLRFDESETGGHSIRTIIAKVGDGSISIIKRTVDRA